MHYTTANGINGGVSILLLRGLRLMPNTRRRRRRDSTVESRRVGGVYTVFATSSRRLPTVSVDNLESEHISLTDRYR